MINKKIDLTNVTSWPNYFIETLDDTHKNLFKSYKNIIQQSGASNINILFSNKNNTNIIITNPKLEDWLIFKINQFSLKSKSPLFSLNGGGQIIEELGDEWVDKGNAPWKLNDIDGLIEVLKKIDQNNL
jgi:hypothetical protein